MSELVGKGVAQSNHLNQSAAFREGISHMDGIAVSLKGTISGGEHNLFHASMNAAWRYYKSEGMKTVTNQQYEEILEKALAATGGFTPSEIQGLLKIAKVAREKAGYIDGPNGLLPKIPDKIDWP